jgi:clan AA aspartic protease (TIGR02281 family)
VNGIDGTFVVDTGASFVVLTADFAMRAKVDVFRQSVPIDTANGRAESTLGRAATVRLGRRIEAGDVPILIQNRSLGRDVDGLLGMSFLSRFDLSIGRRDWSLSPRK